MKKYLVILLSLVGSILYSQNAVQLEGTWKNQDDEILKMGWKVFQRNTPTGVVTGTWEEVDANTLQIVRSTGEEYRIRFAVKGTTFVIERPFSDEVWVWYKIY